MASRIDAAGSVLIMCGNGCHGAAAELRALSDRLKAPLIHSVKGQDIMPYDDPHWMGGIGFIGSKPVYKAVMSADLLLMVGTDYPYSNFLPNRPVVVQIDERPEVLGRRAPTALGVVGSARPTLKLLIEQVAPKSDLLKTEWMDEAGRAAYYAGFHAAQALIVERTGRSPKSHAGVCELNFPSWWRTIQDLMRIFVAFSAAPMTSRPLPITIPTRARR